LSRKFGCTIPSKLYAQTLSASLREKFKFKAYVITGRARAARVREWSERERAPQVSNIQFFFEGGDNWQKEFKQRLMEDGFPEPIFKSKRDRYSRSKKLIEPGLIPFQASDVLAHIIFVAEKYYRRGKEDWDQKENIHWMLEDLESAVEGPLNRFTPADLDNMELWMRANSVDLLGSTTITS
jgi:hypothetical protein